MCESEKETIFYCLRNCKEAITIWLKVLSNNFFVGSIHQWMLTKLRGNDSFPSKLASDVSFHN